MAKIYILAILSDCKQLCGINCAFKKKVQYSEDIKKEKNVKITNNNICVQSNVSTPDLWVIIDCKLYPIR